MERIEVALEEKKIHPLKVSGRWSAGARRITKRNFIKFRNHVMILIVAFHNQLQLFSLGKHSSANVTEPKIFALEK